MPRIPRKWLIASLSGVGLTVVVLGIHEVPVTPTTEDRAYAALFLADGRVDPLPPDADFEGQLAFIVAVQRAVLARAGEDRAIPFARTRELKDLYAARAGLCFDRSRAIETILRTAGLEARHVAAYSTASTGSALRSLLTAKVPSHALSEVLTHRGWMVVDSNMPWIAVDRGHQPHPIADIEADARSGSIAWCPEHAPSVARSPVLREPFTYLYGLYSRHGQFYPPFDLLPDVNYREFAHNVLR